MGAIGTFLVLTFAITWTLWAVVLRAASASPEPSYISPLVTLGGPVLVIGVTPFTLDATLVFRLTVRLL